MLNDYGKLAVLIVAMVGGFAMILVGYVVGDSSELVTPGVGIVMAALGYVTGNGVLASRGQAPSPVMVPSDSRVRRRLAQVVVQELEADDAEDAAEAERIAREEGLR